MEQHPIPQNVSSYQFKLVGDMTLKQFFQLAGGILVGILFYSSPLLPIIKWPLAIISGLLGVGLAFLPLEERPLEKWIFAFFRAIYSPTIFTWRRGSVSAKLFQDEPVQQATTQEDAALKDYLSKTSQVPSSLGNLEKAESGFLSKLSGLVNNLSATPTKTQAPPVIPSDEQKIIQPLPITVTNIQEKPQAQFVTSDMTQPSPEQPKGLQIPETPPVQFQATTVPHMVVEEQPSTTVVQTSAVSGPVSQVVAGNEMISTRQAMFSVDAAPPNPPSTPNVVVGQIVDQDRRIVEGAIMEIRDSAGRPIRALRSNKAGHFITVTQLDNGHYEIVTERDGYEFAPVNFDATGALIPPILVQGRRLSPLLDMPAVPVKPKYSIN